MTEAAKKHVKWVGNSPRQVIALPDGSDAFCDHGKSVEVSADVAESLLEQEGWEPGRSGGSSGGAATVKELRSQLDALGVFIPSKAKKADLEQLLADHSNAGDGEEE